MNINNYTPTQTSSFDIKTKIKSYLWQAINWSLFRWSPFFCRKYRILLLKIFGAKIHPSCSINRKAIIDFPWNLKMGKLSSIGENTWIYCLDKISIGEKTCIGKGVNLITGSHDINSKNFTLVTKKITIGSGVWIATNATILPNVKIADFAVIASESVVVKPVEDFSVVGGNPAKFIKKRSINE